MYVMYISYAMFIFVCVFLVLVNHVKLSTCNINIFQYGLIGFKCAICCVKYDISYTFTVYDMYIALFRQTFF